MQLEVDDTTINGVPITAGLRVFTNDWEWGTVDAAQFVNPSPLTGVGGQYWDGWYSVTLDSGRTASYNGDRMTTVRPRVR